MFELPPSANPWQLTPYGNTIVFTSKDQSPRIFVDGALKMIDLGVVTSQPGPTPIPLPPEKPPLYSSSVVGTDFDFITDADPNAFQTIEYVGFVIFEMPGSLVVPAPPLLQNAHVFNAKFSDGTQIKIAESQDFGTKEVAQVDAERYTSRLGRLPSLYRQKLKHIVVQRGDHTSFAEDKGHFFNIFSDNATKRIATHDLEETFFHEATHAAIQVDYLTGTAWKAAVAADNAFITDYAKTDDQEDFAESALFAYTMIKHPERFPAVEKTKIEQQIPNRIAFFRTIFV